jgi:hypothetical protein
VEVEPAGDLLAQGLDVPVVGLGVVTAGEPEHLHRRAGGGDAAGVRVGLAESEQRVLGALDQQGRRLDPIQHPGRAAAVEHGPDLRGERAGRCGGLVGGADVGAEPAAGQRVHHGGRVEGGQVGRGAGRVVAGPTAAERVQQPTTGGSRSDAEEQTGPQTLVDAAVGVLRSGGGRLRVLDALVRGEQRGGQGVPGDLRRDRVDPVVVGSTQQRERPAVGATRDADARIAVPVEEDLVAVGEDVDQRREISDLVAGIVQADLAGAGAESAGGVREDDVSPVGEVPGVVGHRLLAAAEPVREDDRGCGFLSGGGRDEQRRVQLDGVVAGSGGDARLLAGDVRCGSGRSQHEEAADGQQGEQEGERAPGAEARAGTHGPADGTHEAGNGRGAGDVPVTAKGAGTPGQGCQSPVVTTTRPGAATSAGTSKKRGAGPVS